MKFSILFSLLFLASACSSLNPEKWSSSEKREFNIEKRWVRSTLTNENLTFRKTNRMKPLVAGDLLIQGNAVDSISGYNRTTGERIWNLKVPGGVEGGGTFAKDFLFFGGNDGSFYCTSVSTGTLHWVFPTRSETLAAPLLHNGVVYFLAGNNVVYALDAETGRQNWLYSRPDSQNISVRGGSKPSISSTGKTLYVGFSDGAIVALDTSNGSLKWEKQLSNNKRFRDIDSSPIVDQDVLYVPGFDNALYALRATTGDVLWKYDKGGYGDVTINLDHLYYATTTDEVIALEKSTGKVLWTHKLTGGLGTQPLYSRGLIVVGESQGRVLFLDAVSGKKISSFETGLGVMSPAASDDTRSEVYFISNEANLFAIRARWTAQNRSFPWL